ncbi:hypothetical protein OQH60_04390 [Campylobacter sp. MIT 21-1685]|uniref:hypothetical protein n=1 Tax=unclassified Campylobacter TaxID=2593542 RepID=UPI00224B9643|nr:MULTISPECIES: hypothetical protein [unclassified Campylobacter]MCX2683158.1 hypothetical protein [Campylobacter sp. MIT 21-1684]MCX2751383.1 hypothetical protein [Campylobacter sp. MIT 21-1682]MCX2807582.1 hypothetical protein [Campylobacter sp. MIT 21-1685]
MYSIVDFSSCLCENDKINLAYEYFKKDFISTPLYLADCIYINPQSHRKLKGKEKIFWHITTRENTISKKREFDIQRACRICWIKQIILNYSCQEIKLFYHREGRVIRLYLWLYGFDFVVILQKLGKTDSFLVTSFYIDKGYNKKIYQSRYEDYINKKDSKLKGCEWF